MEQKNNRIICFTVMILYLPVFHGHHPCIIPHKKYWHKLFVYQLLFSSLIVLLLPCEQFYLVLLASSYYKMASCSKCSVIGLTVFSGWNIFVKFIKMYSISFKCISESCCWLPCKQLGPWPPEERFQSADSLCLTTWSFLTMEFYLSIRDRESLWHRHQKR